MNEFVDSGTPFPPFLFPGIMLVFVQKITFIRRKIQKKTAATGAALLAQICTKSFVGWGASPQTPLGELTALLQTH